MLRVIARMLIDGLRYLHSRNTLLYNFKSTNFVFDEYNNLKFVDFSCARLVTDKEDPEGCPLGYLAPELLNKQELPSMETDIWSLGVLLFEMATGQLPFFGKTEMEVLDAISTCKNLVVPNYSPEFNFLVNSILAKHESERINWESISNHKWNAVGLPSASLSLAFESSRGKSVERLKPISRQKTIEKNLLVSELRTIASLGQTEEKKSIRTKESNFESNKPEKTIQNPQTEKITAHEKSYVSNSPNLTQYNSNTSEKNISIRLQKNSIPANNIGIKKDTTVSALNRNDLTKKTPTHLPVKTPKPETDFKKLKFIRNESTKETTSNNSFVNSNNSNTSTNLPRSESGLIKRRTTPATLKNEQSNSNKVIPPRRMHSKNNSAVVLPQSFLPNESQISADLKSEQFGVESFLPLNFESVSKNNEHFEERRKTPELTKHTRKLKTSFLKKKTLTNPFLALKTQWKSVNKDSEKKLVKMGKELLETRDITSIILNDSIQQIDLNPASVIKIFLSNSEELHTDDNIRNYLQDVHRNLASTANETQKLSVLYHLCRSLSDENLANFIANSPMLEFFVKQAKTVKTKQLKIAYSTLIGLILRHATMMNPNICEFSLVSTLTDQLNDSNDTVKQRALAAYGELLFYASTQAEAVTKNSETLWSSNAILIKVLRTFKDTVSLCYAVKTIENITTKAPLNGLTFATEESVTALVYVFETTRDVYLKSIVLRCLENVLNMNAQLLKILLKRKIQEGCFAVMFDKNCELSSSSISLLLNLSFLIDSKTFESIELFWQKNLKILCDLLLSDNFIQRNEALRFLLLVLLKDSLSFSNLIFEGWLLPNIEKCIKEVPVDDDEDPDIANLNLSLDLFAEIAQNLIEFSLANAHISIAQITTNKPTIGKSKVKILPTKTREENEIESSVNEFADSLDYFCRLLAHLLSAEFLFDLITDSNLTAIFKLLESVGLLLQNCLEETLDAIFSIIALIYKHEEKLQKFVPVLSKNIFWDLVASYQSEDSPESKALKFRLLADMFLMVFIDNFGCISPLIFAKAVQFISSNLNTPVSKINLSALQIFRVCLENNMVSKNELNFKKLIKDIFEAVSVNGVSNINQNFFKCLFHLLSLNPDSFIDLSNYHFVEIGVDYLTRFSGSLNLEEVIESFVLFLQIVHKKAKTNTLDDKISFNGKSLLEILKFGLIFCQSKNGNDLSSILFMVYYCLSLVCNISGNHKLIVDRDPKVSELNFDVVLKLKDKSNPVLAKRIAKIGDILKGMIIRNPF